MASNFLIAINGMKPPLNAWPQGIEWLASEPTATDLAGRAVGANGRISVKLSWNLIPVEGFLWWVELVPAGDFSVSVTHLVLPCPLIDRFIVRDRIEYPYHSYFPNGLLSLIKQNGAKLIWMEGSQFLQGEINLTISELEITYY